MRLPLPTLVMASLLGAALAPAAEKYTGPRPPKADVAYLLHADNLIETETRTAQDDTKKDTTIAWIEGTSSPARTPLAEPVFLFRSEKIPADKLAAYKLEVKNGRREVVVQAKKAKDVAKQIHVIVTRLEDNLYRVEVDQPLENGEYTLSPDGSNDTFSFQIY